MIPRRPQPGPRPLRLRSRICRTGALSLGPTQTISDPQIPSKFCLICISLSSNYISADCSSHLMFQNKMLAKTLLSGMARTLTRSISTAPARLGGDTMVLHKDTPENNSEIPFAFTEENKSRADAILSIYPDGHKRAAVRREPKESVAEYNDIITGHPTAGPCSETEWRLAPNLSHAPRCRGHRHAQDEGL